MTMIISLLVSTSITAGAVVLLLRRIDRRTRPGKMLDEVRAEINGVIVELNATTDRNLQLIEDRIEQLKEVSAQADKRIKLLRTEISKAERSDQLYVQLKKARPATAQQSASKNTAEVGEASPDPGRTASAPEAPVSPPENVAPPSTAKPDSPAVTATAHEDGMTAQKRLRARVWEMYAMGDRIERIAARVGRTEGEIELMVSLLRKDNA